ncbi:MAG: TIGR04255 family protein [Myxococcota bacterium]|nr:TIGR04255 family protein [Myxococcota bacterium]
MTAASRTLPDYASPPVIEVVCGVSFSPLPSPYVPFVGRFWSELGEDFKTCEEAPPLAPAVERFDDPAEIQVEMPLLPRVWFVNSGQDQIVQVQQDRFLCNWRKTAPEHAYPRYENVIQRFYDKLDMFAAFSAKQFQSPLQPTQYELSYINHIPAGAGWSDLGQLGQVVPDFAWRTSGAPRFLPLPEGADIRLAFRLPQNRGRLRVHLHNAQRRTDGVAVLLLELTARGFDSDMKRWFDLGHEWIVRGFADLAGDGVQRLWGRK